ncbi:SMP-30/gluconolactonase/LRE family protein [Egicoccus sp. AB-alg2]|uniref:SMP-30/gluconolactonase/LRE family protein n=1 Tax=Egicoccus sp. AB-alg2 TaxID=3242693 RepID=UPI00359D5C03
MTGTLTAAVVDDHRARLGEGLWWDAPRERLLFVDLERGRVLAHRPGTGHSDVLLDHDDVVTAVLPDRDGRLVLGLRDGLGVWDESAGDAPRLVVPLQADDARLRVNDATVTPDGAVLAGTMHLDDERAGARLHRVDGRGTRVLRDGLTISNGLGFSPDRTILYHADTPTGRVDALTLGRDGEVASVARFVRIPDDAGMPDGLCVDAEGGVWIALYGGGAVRRYLPDGALDTVVEVPASHTTSCAFGDRDLDTLFVTTGGAGEEGGEGADTGGLFAVAPGVRGLSVPPVALSL